MDVATRPDLNIIDGDRAKGQQEKDQCRDHEDRITQLIAELKSKDRCKHVLTSG